jgi:hypothetical protein
MSLDPTLVLITSVCNRLLMVQYTDACVLYLLVDTAERAGASGSKLAPRRLLGQSKVLSQGVVGRNSVVTTPLRKEKNFIIQLGTLGRKRNVCWD